MDRTLPDGVTEQAAWRRLAELKVALYEQMHAEKPDDAAIALQLMEARDRLAQLNDSAPAER